MSFTIIIPKSHKGVSFENTQPGRVYLDDNDDIVFIVTDENGIKLGVIPSCERCAYSSKLCGPEEVFTPVTVEITVRS